MTEKTENISYQFEEFMKYKNANMIEQSKLIHYCSKNIQFEQPDISPFNEQLKLIISSITKGINTNSVIFKNDVKSCINKISKKNYNEYLNKLKSLDFSTQENIYFFAFELIICAMKCPISIKGGNYGDKQSDFKPISELCVDIIKYFATHLGGFHEKIGEIVQQIFMNFVDLNKSMDEHNDNTSDNYKGFMTLIGLLHSKNLINTKVIIENCIDSIKRTIFCSKSNINTEQICNFTTENHEKMFGYNKNFDNELYNTIIYFDSFPQTNPICYRSMIECTNFYRGYEYLLSHIINTFSKKTEHLDKIKDYCEILLKSHEEFTTFNQQYKAYNKTALVPPLKPHIMIIHNELTENLKKVLNELTENLKKSIK